MLVNIVPNLTLFMNKLNNVKCQIIYIKNLHS
jgi:hypothetical protein